MTGDIMNISRLRMGSDGRGVSTLVTLFGCPLRCAYCINDYCHDYSRGFFDDSFDESFNDDFFAKLKYNDSTFVSRYKMFREDTFLNYDTKRGAYSPEELFARVRVDDIYYKMTGGGIVFGGGEPLLQSGFIHEFCRLADPLWTIRIETSLYSDWKNIELIIDDIDEWIVDIKDSDPLIYYRYTCRQNAFVLQNLKDLLRQIPAEKIRVRVPHIPVFNTEKDVQKTISFLKETGITKIDEFEYIQTRPFPGEEFPVE